MFLKESSLLDTELLSVFTIWLLCFISWLLKCKPKRSLRVQISYCIFVKNSSIYKTKSSVWQQTKLLSESLVQAIFSFNKSLKLSHLCSFPCIWNIFLYITSTLFYQHIEFTSLPLHHRILQLGVCEQRVEHQSRYDNGGTFQTSLWPATVKNCLQCWRGREKNLRKHCLNLQFKS